MGGTPGQPLLFFFSRSLPGRQLLASGLPPSDFKLRRKLVVDQRIITQLITAKVDVFPTERQKTISEIEQNILRWRADLEMSLQMSHRNIDLIAVSLRSRWPVPAVADSFVVAAKEVGAEAKEAPMDTEQLPESMSVGAWEEHTLEPEDDDPEKPFDSPLFEKQIVVAANNYFASLTATAPSWCASCW